MKMDIINPNAAGIDIGSISHFVTVNQSEEDVKEFGVFEKLTDWLVLNNIKSVAMESTGTY